MSIETISSSAAFTGILNDYFKESLLKKETDYKDHKTSEMIEENNRVSKISPIYYSTKGRIVETYSNGERVNLLA